MRPVNLLPPEDRKRAGASAPTGRGGAFSYLLVGVLALAVLAVAALTLTGKSIGDKEAEVARLEQREAELTARAASLASFSNFQSIKEARVLTVAALAESRFDWERVMRELALILPERAWLVNLTGTVAPEVSVTNGASISARAEVPGPALELVGCARSQRDVAKFIAALEDIDGVTRVTATEGKKPATQVGPTAGGSDQVTDDCRTRDFISRFQIVAAFDAVAVPEGAVPPAPPAGGGSESAPAAVNDGVSDAESAKAEAKENVNEGGKKVDKAAKLLPGN